MLARWIAWDHISGKFELNLLRSLGRITWTETEEAGYRQRYYIQDKKSCMFNNSVYNE